MIKEIVIFAIAVLALCQAVPVEEPKEKVAILPVAAEDNKNVDGSDDLQPEASAWARRYGGGHGRYGGGHGGGYGGHGGGYGGHHQGGWGHRQHWG